MARFLPADFPDRIEEDPSLQAEWDFFNRCKSQLDDRFTILHSVKYLRDTRRGVQEGEMDFLFLIEGAGMLVVEVKGGILEVSDGVWYQHNRRRTRKNRLRRSPFSQADRARHQLANYFQQKRVEGVDRRTIGHIVVLPYCEKPSAPMGPGCPPELCLDIHDLDRLAEAMEQALGFWFSKQAEHPVSLDHDTIDMIVDALGFCRKLGATVGGMITCDRHRLGQPSPHQNFVLDQLPQLNRVAVRGCAGSGKTCMAIAESIRRARQGQRVGLFCYNRLLGERLKESVAAALNADAEGSVTVGAFLEHCLQFLPSPPSKEQRHQQQFWTDLPAGVHLDMLEEGGRFDAIVVDEAQDFRAPWWPILVSMLEQPQRGVLHLFYDEEQCIYGKPELPMDLHFTQLLLLDNHRNPSDMGQFIRRFCGSKIRFQRPGTGRLSELLPDGRPLPERLGDLLHSLVLVEGVAPEDIIILTPNTRGKSRLQDGVVAGGFRVARDPKCYRVMPSRSVACTSVHRFKGLESPIVIGCEFGSSGEAGGGQYHISPLGQCSPGIVRQIRYTAFSRATTALYILWD